jgi:hypothetical protein
MTVKIIEISHSADLNNVTGISYQLTGLDYFDICS